MLSEENSSVVSVEIGGISDSKLKSIFTFLLVESLRIDGFNGYMASIKVFIVARCCLLFTSLYVRMP